MITCPHCGLPAVRLIQRQVDLVAIGLRTPGDQTDTGEYEMDEPQEVLERRYACQNGHEWE